VEEIFLTVRELAELKGCTERYIRTLIEKGKMLAETVEVNQRGPGRGGIQYRIPLSSLEKSLQTKFKRRLKAVKKQENEVVIEKEEPLQVVDIETLSHEERQRIIFWKNLIEDWQKFRNNGANKAEADEAYVEICNKNNPNLNLTRRTLYRKDKVLREHGETALVDKRGKHKAHAKKLTDDIWDIFEYYYLDQSRKTVTLCMTLTELSLKHQGKEELLPLPSVTTFQRAVNVLPIPYIKYFRHNEKQFIGECSPYIKRMYDDLESNDIWVADNHTFDILVGKEGKTVRVYLTAFMDVRSRKMMGWCITDAPSADATIYALKKGCEHHGIPKMLYTDNGREFLFHDLGGNGFRKKKTEELKLPSILDDLSVEFRTALPRNARAKGIERAFDTIKETFSKLYDSYTGGTVLERPDRNKDLAKRPSELTQVDDFIAQVDIYIQGWYNKQPHRGEGMNGKCPDEVFAINLIEKRVVQQEKLNLMFMRYAKGNKGTLKVGKNGVSLKFYGQELQFWNEDLWRLYFGRDVYVRYSPDDLSNVRVYDNEMRYVCTAELRTRLGYKATKEEIMTAQAENRRAVKVLKSYKKVKNVEAEDALKLILDEAERSIDNPYEPNPKIIRPIYGSNEAFGHDGIYQKVVGDYGEPLDWAEGVERLRKMREEE